MNVVIITDDYIPENYIKLEFDGLVKKYGLDISYYHWEVGGLSRLSKINRLIEKEGPEFYKLSPDLISACQGADLLITHFCPINEELIDACINLKYVCVMRGGVENINTEYLNTKKILWFTLSGLVSDAVADFTLGLILSETRNIARSHANLCHGKWIQNYSNKENIIGLKGRFVGIIGIGEVGIKVAKRLTAFGAKMIGFEPTDRFSPGEIVEGIKIMTLDEVLIKSDIVTIHARLIDKTIDLINQKNLKLMKPSAYLINTARGELINEEALIEALRHNRLAGAALDVFTCEPLPPKHPFTKLRNVTLTPHIAGKTMDELTDSPIKLRSAIENLLSGKPPTGYNNYAFLYTKEIRK